MFCKNCGKPINNNPICSYCGINQVDKNKVNTNNIKKSNKNVFIIIAVVLILITILLYIFVFKDKENMGTISGKPDFYVYYDDLYKKYYLSDKNYEDNEPVYTYTCEKKCYEDDYSNYDEINLGNRYSFILDGKDLVYIDQNDPKGFAKATPTSEYEIKIMDATMYKYNIDEYNYYAILSTKNNVFGVTRVYNVFNENYGSNYLFTMDEDSEILYNIGISESGLDNNLIYIDYEDATGEKKKIIYNISTNTEEKNCEGFVALGGNAVLKQDDFIVLVSYHNEKPYVSIYTKDYKLIENNINATQIEIKDNTVIINYSNSQRIFNSNGEQIQ